jgi:hypothetical protein
LIEISNSDDHCPEVEHIVESDETQLHRRICLMTVINCPDGFHRLLKGGIPVPLCAFQKSLEPFLVSGSRHSGILEDSVMIVALILEPSDDVFLKGFTIERRLPVLIHKTHACPTSEIGRMHLCNQLISIRKCLDPNTLFSLQTGLNHLHFC